ncbi:transcription initiation factor IIE subunit alpha-like [Salvia hispanica]|uniref:transcription initiation factor IIE subunit alpha-like n=1 Tax=Salvia hispanica TaxID=49212 RepID=UPI002008F976|nr:transcription initiation factor IIE subunit alpha-like [Salvia hispanica]
MASVDPFNRLVRLTARAFYDDITTKGENQQRPGRSDNRGIAVVILDALTRRQWTKEEDLARDLKLHTKQLRRTLRFFEEEKLVTRDHRKETSKSAKMFNAAVAATVDGQKNGRDDEKQKLQTQSYCCLDYSQIYDVVRYRLHRMRKKLKDELESKNTVQEYICPDCNKKYNALDALRLITPYDEYFHCESCNGILVAESDKLAAQEMGDGDDNASRRRLDKLRDMLSKMEVQLKPLIDQLGRVKDLPVPELEGLQAWLVRKATQQAANGDHNTNDPNRHMNGGFGGTPMPYVGETKVEVAFSGADDKGDVKSINASTPMKVLPPWMIKQGMNLTKEQRGETSQETKMGGSSVAMESTDDKKAVALDEDKNKIQDEYVRAYYAAVLEKLHPGKEENIKREAKSPNDVFASEVYSTPSERQVGMKSKREDEFEGDDIEWEDGPSTGNTSDHFKVHDLNVEAEATQDDEDENDWEDG